jgi:transcriptional regulator of arginine metabolism
MRLKHKYTLKRDAMNKNERMEVIKEIIRTKNIESQEEMLCELEKRKIVCTQATLSRDLKRLKVSRVVGEDKKYIYTLTDEVTNFTNAEKEMCYYSFISIVFSGNMASIKTLPGYANSITSVIDSLELNEVAGTIAGDDTIFLLLAEDVKKEDFIEVLLKEIPTLKSKI